jgi:hypothetical protein
VQPHLIANSVVAPTYEPGSSRIRYPHCSMVPRKKLGPSVGDGELSASRTKWRLMRLDSVEGVVQSRFQSLVLVEGALSTSGNGPTILIRVNDDGVLHWPHSAQ